MDTLTCQIVRPDKLLYEGEATSVVLAARTGELGVFPKHGAEVCALGDGVMRINRPEGTDGPQQLRVVIMGGYAEVANDVLIVLATHARRIDDIEVDVVSKTRGATEAKLNALPADDHRRAYYEEKIAWCDLLARESEKEAAGAGAR